MNEQGLRIISLQAENFQRLVAVQIDVDPNDSIIMVTGANGHGKTSALDIISVGIGGERMIPPKPIRDGAEDAWVRIVLYQDSPNGDGPQIPKYIVKRTFTAKGTYLTVQSADGQLRSPQAFLNELYGDYTLDPMAFTRMSPKEQRDRLLSICGLGEMLHTLNESRRALYDERTLASREVKRLEGAASQFGDAPAKRPTPVDVAELVGERKRRMELSNYRRKLDERIVSDRRDAKEFAAKSAQRSALIERLREQIQQEQEAIRAEEEHEQQAIRRATETSAELHRTVEPTFDDLDVKTASAGAVNTAVRRYDEHATAMTHLADARAIVDGLSQQIVAIDESKADVLANTSPPVADLSVDDNSVLYKQIPFCQASSAEQLRVSLAIAMAASPKLRVIRITDGSLLDSKSMDIIREMTREQGYQVWVESVQERTADGSLPSVGIYIEEGEVVGVNGVAVERAILEG